MLNPEINNLLEISNILQNLANQFSTAYSRPERTCNCGDCGCNAKEEPEEKEKEKEEELPNPDDFPVAGIIPNESLFIVRDPEGNIRRDILKRVMVVKKDGGYEKTSELISNPFKDDKDFAKFFEEEVPETSEEDGEDEEECPEECSCDVEKENYKVAVDSLVGLVEKICRRLRNSKAVGKNIQLMNTINRDIEEVRSKVTSLFPPEEDTE